MSFVFPLLLGGLALISIPILIHLILRQKPKTVKFPAFRFLVQRHKRNLRKLRLRHLLLLALRILLLVLISLALAQPKVISEAWNLSMDRPVVAILLFDTSMSMEYKITGGQSRLEDAKKRGLELLQELPAGSEVMVLDSAEPVLSSKGDFLPVAKARQRIESLRLRYDSRPVTDCLQKAYGVLANLATSLEDRMRRMPRLVCVFSDGMQSSWDSGEVKKVLEAQDRVPPPLERLQLMQNSLAARLELLESLQENLPSPEGKDYLEQTLIDDWQKLRPLIASAHPDDFPDADSLRLVTGIRQQTREILKIVQSFKKDELSPSAQEFRERLIDSLRKTLDELQGVWSVYVNVGVDNPADLAILKLEMPPVTGGRLERSIFAPDETFVLQALVQATGQGVEGSLICEVGGKKLSRSVALTAGQSQRYHFEIDCKALSPGLHQLEVRLSRPDLLDFTNRQFATFAIRQSRRVLIVTDNPASAETFRRAIDFQEEARFRCDVKTPEEFAQLEPRQLSAYHAIYLFNVANPKNDVWAALKNYAARGGNIAIVPGGEATVLEAYNDNKLARELMPGELKKLANAEPGLIWTWDDANIYQHPFFKRFQDWWFVQVDFLKNPRRATRYWLVEPYEKSQVLVRYNDPKGKVNPPAVLEHDSGKGKVILLTTRLDVTQDEPWNNYMTSGTSFVVVLPNELTRYLAGDSERVELNFVSGKEVPRVNLPLDNRDPTFTIKGPDVFDSVARPLEDNELLFPRIVSPGNYEVLAGTGSTREVIGAFSVNFPADEAVLKSVPLLELESVFGRDRVVTLTQQMDLKSGLHGHWSEPSELFPWLMVGLLVFLTLENLLSNLFYRRETQTQV